MAREINSHATARYRSVVASFVHDKAVTCGGTKGFGAGALKANGRIFAMLAKEEFVVKLPQHRIEELTCMGLGKPFELRPGRLMKEWFVVNQNGDWGELAKEARRFLRNADTPDRIIRNDYTKRQKSRRTRK